MATNVSVVGAGLLNIAEEFARAAHDGQKRKGLDEPYFAHPLRVMNLAAECNLSVEAMAAALLHDVVEDGPDGTSAKLKQLGLPKRVLELVWLLTKWWRADEGTISQRRLDMQQYYHNIAQDPEALTLKLLDRADNLADAKRVLPSRDGEGDFVKGALDLLWVDRYYQKTCIEFGPLVAGAMATDHGQLAVVRMCGALIQLREALITLADDPLLRADITRRYESFASTAIATEVTRR